MELKAAIRRWWLRRIWLWHGWRCRSDCEVGVGDWLQRVMFGFGVEDFEKLVTEWQSWWLDCDVVVVCDGVGRMGVIAMELLGGWEGVTPPGGGRQDQKKKTFSSPNQNAPGLNFGQEQQFWGGILPLQCNQLGNYQGNLLAKYVTEIFYYFQITNCHTVSYIGIGFNSIHAKKNQFEWKKKKKSQFEWIWIGPN